MIGIKDRKTFEKVRQKIIGNKRLEHPMTRSLLGL